MIMNDEEEEEKLQGIKNVNLSQNVHEMDRNIKSNEFRINGEEEEERYIKQSFSFSQNDPAFLNINQNESD